MSIQVHVRDQRGDVICVDVEDDCTVGRLRSAIATAKGVTPSSVRVEYGGERWENDQELLSNTAFEAGDEVDLLGRPIFRAGHRIEARDRKNPGLLCVATVAAVDTDDERRIKVHFDGWTDYYDYWTSDDTLDIAPVGTCREKGLRLEAPHRCPNFSTWEAYLEELDVEAAPVECFLEGDYFSNADAHTRRQATLAAAAAVRHATTTATATATTTATTTYDDTPDASATGVAQFQVGQRLEARDRRNPRLLCPATVKAVNGRMIKVGFDGWTTRYDYMVRDTSTDIAPCGTCYAQGRAMEVPQGVTAAAFANWDTYLTSVGASAAPPTAFRAAPGSFFGGVLGRTSSSSARPYSQYAQYRAGAAGTGAATHNDPTAVRPRSSSQPGVSSESWCATS